MLLNVLDLFPLSKVSGLVPWQ